MNGACGNPRHTRAYRLPAEGDLPPGPWVCDTCRPCIFDAANSEWRDTSDLAAPSSPDVKARSGDPESSRAAARRSVPRQGTQRWVLLQAIAASDDGLTAEQAAGTTGLRYVSASTRVSELEQQGFVVRRGERPTSTGTNADVLWATDAGREALAGTAVAA